MIFVLSEKPVQDAQTFAIFGPDRARCGAFLYMQELMELQRPGIVTDTMSETISSFEGFDQDCFLMKGTEASYICGTKASTLKKLMVASNAVLSLVGSYCLVAGTIDERKR